MEIVNYGKMDSKVVRLIQIFKKYPIYLSIIIITIIVGENYPLSYYPMYNNFPNWSYTFYFTDSNERLIDLPEITHAQLSHKFYAECNLQKVNYGNGIESKTDLQYVGGKLTHKLFDNIFRKRTKLNLFRIYNHLEKGIINSDTTLISSCYVK